MAKKPSNHNKQWTSWDVLLRKGNYVRVACAILLLLGSYSSALFAQDKPSRLPNETPVQEKQPLTKIPIDGYGPIKLGMTKDEVLSLSGIDFYIFSNEILKQAPRSETSDELARILWFFDYLLEKRVCVSIIFNLWDEVIRVVLHAGFEDENPAMLFHSKTLDILEKKYGIDELAILPIKNSQDARIITLSEREYRDVNGNVLSIDMTMCTFCKNIQMDGMLAPYKVCIAYQKNTEEDTAKNQEKAKEKL